MCSLLFSGVICSKGIEKRILKSDSKATQMTIFIESGITYPNYMAHIVVEKENCDIFFYFNALE